MRLRMNNRVRWRAALAVLGLLGVCGMVVGWVPQPEQGQPFGTIDVLSLSGGGSTQAQGLRLDVTIGEPLAGVAGAQGAGADMQLLTGFWAVIGDGALVPLVPGDTNGDGVVDVDDLIAVILAWGPCPTPPAPCPADVDDSGTVDVDDLITVILNWS